MQNIYSDTYMEQEITSFTSNPNHKQTTIPTSRHIATATGQDALLQERVTIATSLKAQQTIAQSSAEVELYAIDTTVNDVIYVRNFLHELNFTTDDK
eukprot:4112671-Amphidinium_carterae.1